MSALENAKVGDMVIMYGGGWHSRRTIEEIEKVTSTQVHVAGRRFNRTTGRKVGDRDWRSPSISVPIDGEIQEVNDENEKASLVSQFRAKNWDKEELSTLRNINLMLNAVKLIESVPVEGIPS